MKTVIDAKGWDYLSIGDSIIKIVFSIPFTAFGLFLGYQCIHMYGDVIQMKRWVETPATVMSVSRNAGGKPSAEYCYSYQGQTYTNHRIEVESLSSNNRTEEDALFTRLNKAHAEGRTILCYVSPQSPERAILNRDPNMSVFLVFGAFAVVISGFGMAVCFIFVRKIGKTLALESLREKWPDTPWRWRKEWASKEIGAAMGNNVLSFFFMSVAVSVPMLSFFCYYLLQVQKDAHGFPWGVLIIPAVCIPLLTVPGIPFIRRLRFRNTVLILPDMPVRLGSRLEAKVRLPDALQTTGSVNVCLQCVRRTSVRRTGDSDGGGVSERELWKQALHVGGTKGTTDQVFMIPLQFDMPQDQPATEFNAGGDKVVWRLRVRAKTSGPDLDVTFDLPVFT